MWQFVSYHKHGNFQADWVSVSSIFLKGLIDTSFFMLLNGLYCTDSAEAAALQDHKHFALKIPSKLWLMRQLMPRVSFTQ